jgi:hypothetical protein
MPRRTVVAILFAVGLLAAAAPSWADPDVQVTPDSAAYLSAAQNLVEGKGITTAYPVETTRYPLDEQFEFDRQVPFTEWPPLFPVALASLMALGAGAVEAVQLLNGLSLAATAILAVLIVRRLAGGRLVPALVAAVLVLLGPVASTSHPLEAANPIGQAARALSESFYLPLFLATLLLATRSDEGPSGPRRRRRVGAPLLAAAASLTRFVGVAAGAGAAGALVLRPDRRQHLRRIVALLAAGPAGILLWSGLRSLWWGAGSGEELGWHPPTGESWHELVDVLGGWCLLPPSLPWPVRGTIAAAALAAVVVVTLDPRRRRRVTGPELSVGSPAGDLLSALVVAAVVHVLVVVATVTFFDAGVPLSQRTLGAAQAALYLAAFGLVVGWVLRQRVPLRRMLASGAILLVALACLPGSLWLVGARSQAGLGRSSLATSSSAPTERTSVSPVDGGQTGSLVPDVPADMVVVTNMPGRLWFETSAQLLMVPPSVLPVSGRPNPDLVAQSHDVGQLLAERDGIVVLHEAAQGAGRSIGSVRESLVEHAELVPLGACGTDVEVLARRATAAAIAALIGC